MMFDRTLMVKTIFVSYFAGGISISIMLKKPFLFRKLFVRKVVCYHGIMLSKLNVTPRPRALLRRTATSSDYFLETRCLKQLG